MADPVFTQAQVEGLMAVKKVAPFESQFYAAVDIRSRLLKPVEIRMQAEEPFESVELWVRIMNVPRIGAFAISLAARLANGRREFLCRYDLHDSPHPNKPRCDDPGEIPSGVFHVHLYRPDLVAVGYDWDDCGEPRPLDGQSHAEQARNIMGQFLKELRVEFEDRSKYNDLFRMADG